MDATTSVKVSARSSLAMPLDASKVLEAKLAKLRRTLDTEVQCPVCDDCLYCSESNDQIEVTKADIYCRTCRQMLCSACCEYHRRAKALRSHVLVAFEKSPIEGDFSLESKVPGLCKRHSDKQHLLNTFCYDCNEVLCKKCLEEIHSKHRWTDVTDVSDRFKKEISDHISSSLSSKKLVIEKKEHLNQEQNESQELIQQLKAAIERTREELKQSVDRQADRLLLEIQQLQEERSREIETSIAKLEEHLLQVDCFKAYATEIAERRSVSDVCQSVADLKIVNNILENETKEITQSELRRFPISFTTGEFKRLMENEDLNYFGKIEGKFAYTMTPGVPVAISNEATPTALRFISGITVLKNEIFTTRYMTSEIEVYNSWHQFIRVMRIGRQGSAWQLTSNNQHLRDPHCIASCMANECLYVVNRTEKEFSEIVKIDPTGILLKKWTTVDDNSYGRISVTDKGNIVKALHIRSRLMEYTSEGQVIREVILPDCIQRPWHAIQTPNGDFIVSHGQYGDKNHRVCILDSNGKLKASFSMDGSLDTKYLNCPVYLAVCADGTIVCIDANNRRVLMLSSVLEFQRELLTRVNGIKGRPHAICIDENHLMISVEDKFITFEMRTVSTDPKPDLVLGRSASVQN